MRDDDGLHAVARRLCRHGRRASLPVLVSVLLALAAAALFLANLDRPRGPLILLWLAAPLSTVVSGWACWRTARAARLAPTRRFWSSFGIVCVLVTIGTVSFINDSIGTGTAVQRIGPATLVAYVGSILIILWAMFRLPLGTRSRGDRLRFGLDAGTVLLAAAVFMWHYHTRLLLRSQADDTASLVVSAIAMVLALVGVFAVAKVVLSRHSFVARGSLWLLGLGLIVGSFGPLAQTLLHDKPHLVCSQVSIPAVMICATAAAEWQRRAASYAPATGQAESGGRFSVLPYVAVAAVDGLLVASTWSAPGDGQRVVALAAVALTALVVVRQITAFQQIRRLLARLDHGATHDALTRLPNRALFADRLQRALTGPDPDRCLSVVLIDLDDFKPINDTFGHAVGDALLVVVAQRLAAAVRDGDTVARLGGDEFVVLLDDIDPAGADLVVQRLTAAFGVAAMVDGHELTIRASIGIADGSTGDDPAELLRRADIAMYAAKNGGGGSARFRPDPVSRGVEHISTRRPTTPGNPHEEDASAVPTSGPPGPARRSLGAVHAGGHDHQYTAVRRIGRLVDPASTDTQQVPADGHRATAGDARRARQPAQPSTGDRQPGWPPSRHEADAC